MASLIRERRYARQLIDFGGLRFGTGYPTDIDAFIDFGNELFILIEAKKGDAELPLGQRLALERICDGLAETRKHAIVLVVSHDDAAPEAIDLANARATTYRRRGKWKDVPQGITCREFIVKAGIHCLGYEKWNRKYGSGEHVERI